MFQNSGGTEATQFTRPSITRHEPCRLRRSSKSRLKRRIAADATQQLQARLSGQEQTAHPSSFNSLCSWDWDPAL